MSSQMKNSKDLHVISKGKNAASKRTLRLSSNRFPFLLLLCFLAFLIFSYGGQLNKLHAMQKDVENIKTQITDIKNKNQELRDELNRIRSEAYIEKVAREELGLIKKNEMLVVPLDPSNPGQVPAFSAGDQIIRD